MFLHLLWLILLSGYCEQYLIEINEFSKENRPNNTLFRNEFRLKSNSFLYKLSDGKSGEFLSNLIQVDKLLGNLIQIDRFECNNDRYPNVFTVFIELVNFDRFSDFEYCLIPVKIVIRCRTKNVLIGDQLFESQLISFKYPLKHFEPFEICLKKSELLISLKQFLPSTILEWCNITHWSVFDDKFQIEHSTGDLISIQDQCFQMKWSIFVKFRLQCLENSVLYQQNVYENSIKILFYYWNNVKNDYPDVGNRVRRELSDDQPIFEKPLYVAQVLEECEIGTLVTSMKTKNFQHIPVIYSMASLLHDKSGDMFEIESENGLVKTKMKLDREQIDLHYFRVVAINSRNSQMSATTTLQINVLDINDHSPIFEKGEYEASVKESLSIGSTVITVKATDKDTGKNSEIEYSIESVNGGGLAKNQQDNQMFRIDAKTGLISNRLQLDRETTNVYTMIVLATDQAPLPLPRNTASATVIVHVLDENDNLPQFVERTYSVSIKEDINIKENPIIAGIRAVDFDEGINAAIRYTIIGGNTETHFAIDSVSGDVTVLKPLDYERQKSFRLIVRAQDGGSPSRLNTTQLLVNLIDVNDNPPRFYTSFYKESIPETTDVGTNIIKVQAYDNDEGNNSKIEYSLSLRDESGQNMENMPLAIYTQTGWIYSLRPLDREEREVYKFHVIATDLGEPPLSASVSVIINIQDVNDNNPIFESHNYDLVLSEDAAQGTPVISLVATDKDENSYLRYEITDGNTRNRFAITSQNQAGLITLAQPLDYKQEKRYVLTISAFDPDGRYDTAIITINVTDANNYAPVFENMPFTASVYEDVPIGTTIMVISAVDNDVGINAQIKYSFVENDNGKTNDFALNAQTGAITTTKLLDREITSGYLLTIEAKDSGNPPLSDTTEIEIVILDVNDNAPVFKRATYTASVSEDTVVGSSVLEVTASDSDLNLNAQIRYSLSNQDIRDGHFAIDQSNGVIRTNKALDRESVPIYLLNVIASDLGTPSLSSSVSVHVHVDDINDSPPSFGTDKIVLYIPENSPVGSKVGEIVAKDPDEGINALVQYSIIGGEDSNKFSLMSRPDSEGAELLTMIELDYESNQKSFQLIIRASSHPLRSDVTVEIIVTDVNDNAPVLKDFHIIFNNFKGHFPYGSIGRIPAFDADVSDQLRYKILQGNNGNLVTLNETSGLITLSAQLNTNVPKVAIMEVFVTDGLNEIKALMKLTVRMITEEMLFNSITVRLNHMTKEAFLSSLLNFFIDGLSAIIPCSKDDIYLFGIENDVVNDNYKRNVLNVSLSIRKSGLESNEFYTSQYLQEKIYLNRAILARLASVQVLPFDDNLCVREPCLNYEQCLTVLKFGNATDFISSEMFLFRSITPITTFACRCPKGFAGSKESYLCDTELNLCYSNPCKNHGICHRIENGYKCECSAGFFGVQCEQITDEKSICSTSLEKLNCDDCTNNSDFEMKKKCRKRVRSFSKGSFLTFPSLKQRNRLNIQLRFATKSNNGLLLYNGRFNDRHDFIALEIINGQVEFIFSLGSKITRTVVQLETDVSDGNWHYVTVDYHNRTIILSVDNCDNILAINHGQTLGSPWSCANRSEQVLEKRCVRFTEICYRFLDLTGPLQIGGLPDIPTKFQTINKHFEGCLADVKIDHDFLDLENYVSDNGTVIGCPQKKTTCSYEKPCLNEGICHDGWNGYVCECKQEFGGKNCELILKQVWYFNGNGNLTFNPLLQPIKLPWICSFSIRTLKQDAFLIAIEIGQTNFITFSLKSRKLFYQFDDETIIHLPFIIADGNWHHVAVKWFNSEIIFSIDFDQFKLSIPFSNSLSLQGLYVGKTIIGSNNENEDEVMSFNGCLKEILIGESAMDNPTQIMNVIEGCPSNEICSINSCSNSNMECFENWGMVSCQCKKGHVGSTCRSVCDYYPCNDGQCLLNSTEMYGYKCSCNKNYFIGEHCEIQVNKPCPTGWWGYPVCVPCLCSTMFGYNHDCNKTTGQCSCKENYYKPPNTNVCRPCNCYLLGSYSSQCDSDGRCKCRDGVIGHKCDMCPNSYSEVTSNGCQVVYDSCPRSFRKIWWPRTLFSVEAKQFCPSGSHGESWRLCSNDSNGWLEPNFINCTSNTFKSLKVQLAQLDKEELIINTYVAINLLEDLLKAINGTFNLYVNDLLISEGILSHVLRYETTVNGFNLTHSQDRDYLQNLLQILNILFDDNLIDKWYTLSGISERGIEYLLQVLNEYLVILTHSQYETYTNPFEIVTDNCLLGLDVVVTDALYSGINYNKTPKLMDLLSSEYNKPYSNLQNKYISIPKYNNYVFNNKKFDKFSTLLIPKSFFENIAKIHSMDSFLLNHGVVSYMMFKNLGLIMPKSYHESVVHRWGSDLIVGSPVLSIHWLMPSTISQISNNVILPEPILLQIWLNSNYVNDRSNPQCVHWMQMPNERGQWSRVGCETILSPDWYKRNPILVNCSCSHLSTFAVLIDKIDSKIVPKYSLVKQASIYSGFSISVPFLIITWLTLTAIRGVDTNSNAIHRHIVLCILIVEFLYLIAWSSRSHLVVNDSMCRLIAIALHYMWLCAFAWTLIDALHLYRMFTELRDINHGSMPVYYNLGYVVPAIMICLAVAVRADQYGNYQFCWLSVHESVVWSLVGPVSIMMSINLVLLALCVCTAFTIKEHILDYGNLSTLLWTSLISLPLLSSMWALAIFAVNEPNSALTYLLSVVMFIHSLFCLTAYCFINGRVKQSIIQMFRGTTGVTQTKSKFGSTKCLTTKNASGAMKMSTIQTNPQPFRHLSRISTSSTTSHSTTNPHLTSTSTSNYNSSNSRQNRTHGSFTASADNVSGSKNSLELASSHTSDEDESCPRLSYKNQSSPPSSISINQKEVLQFNPDTSTWLNSNLQTTQVSIMKTRSPNPLPMPENYMSMTLDMESFHAMHKKPEIINGDRIDNIQNDKYAFPYTAEEDHSITLSNCSDKRHM